MGGFFHKPESNPPLESHPILLNEHLPAILAAFHLEASDLDRIRTVASLGDTSELNLQKLRIIYRYVVFARVLKLKVEDLAVLLNIVREYPCTADLFHPIARWEDTENRFLNQDPHCELNS